MFALLQCQRSGKYSLIPKIYNKLLVIRPTSLYLSLCCGARARIMLTLFGRTITLVLIVHFMKIILFNFYSNSYSTQECPKTHQHSSDRYLHRKTDNRHCISNCRYIRIKKKSLLLFSTVFIVLWISFFLQSIISLLSTQLATAVFVSVFFFYCGYLVFFV